MKILEKTLKVVHVVPGLDNPVNGIANAARRIAAEQEALGYDVCLLDRAIHFSEARAADVVFVHSMFRPLEWISCLIAAGARTRLVRMPHGCLDPVRFHYHRLKKRLVWPIERLCFALSDVIYATSDAEVRWMRGLGRSVINVPLGVDVLTLQALPFPTPSDLLTVLCLCRLHPLKGVESLIRAVAQVPGIRLELAGCDEKNLRERYVALVRALKATDRITFLGELLKDDKRAAFARCELFCLPSLSENFGIVVGEACSYGRPVLTTDGASSWEDLPRANAGWYLTPYAQADESQRTAALKGALVDALSRRADLPQMGERARMFVRDNFNWRENVKRLMSLV